MEHFAHLMFSHSPDDNIFISYTPIPGRIFADEWKHTFEEMHALTEEEEFVLDVAMENTIEALNCEGWNIKHAWQEEIRVS